MIVIIIVINCFILFYFFSFIFSQKSRVDIILQYPYTAAVIGDSGSVQCRSFFAPCNLTHPLDSGRQARAVQMIAAPTAPALIKGVGVQLLQFLLSKLVISIHQTKPLDSAGRKSWPNYKKSTDPAGRKTGRTPERVWVLLAEKLAEL